MGKTAECLIELSSDGYTKTNSSMEDYIYRHPEFGSHVFRFSSGIKLRGGGGDIKYSSLDIFGETLFYYILDCEDAKKEFAEHLVKKFLCKNPNPERGLRKVFTNLLHQYNIHSDLCWKRNCGGILEHPPDLLT